MRQTTIKQSLVLLQIEAIFTGVVFAMPIFNVFYAQEIGMTMAQVGLSQAVFTVAVLTLNIPTGWLADRFSRKACNVFGDALAALAFVYYALAHTFADVVIAEILVGIGLAFSGGADVGLLHAYAHKLKISYHDVMARISSTRPIADMIAVSIGGVIGAYSLRLAIALSAVTYAIGAILSLFLVEAGDHRKNDVHPVRDMARITRYALHGHKRLAWSILAYALSREMTHALVWLLTPLLILAGVPAYVIGMSWALNLTAVLIGARLAHAYAMRLTEWQRFGVGICSFVIASCTLSIGVNLATIAFYTGFGFARGWISTVMMPIVQRHTPSDIQSTVVSVASSVAQLMYIPIVWGIGALADISPRIAVLGNLMIFAPFIMIAVYKLRQFEPIKARA